MHQSGHPSWRRRLLAALCAFGSLSVFHAPPAVAQSGEVTAAGLAFSPPTVSLELTAGEPGFEAAHAHVTWTMADADTQHTVTFDDPKLVSSQPLSAGQRHEVVIYAVGTYPYRCTIHPTMTGSIVVTPAPPAAAPVRSPDAEDPGPIAGSGSGSGSLVPVAIGLSVLASAAVLAWYLLRDRRTRLRPGADGPEAGSSRESPGSSRPDRR